MMNVFDYNLQEHKFLSEEPVMNFSLHQVVDYNFTAAPVCPSQHRSLQCGVLVQYIH
jgi:hypothetical protein